MRGREADSRDRREAAPGDVTVLVQATSSSRLVQLDRLWRLVLKLLREILIGASLCQFLHHLLPPR